MTEAPRTQKSAGLIPGLLSLVTGLLSVPFFWWLFGPFALFWGLVGVLRAAPARYAPGLAMSIAGAAAAVLGAAMSPSVWAAIGIGALIHTAAHGPSPQPTSTAIGVHLFSTNPSPALRTNIATHGSSLNATPSSKPTLAAAPVEHTSRVAHPLAQNALQNPPANVTPQPDQNDPDLVFWQSIDPAKAPELKAYLKSFPNGKFAALAKAKLTTIEKQSGQKESPPPTQPQASTTTPQESSAAPESPTPTGQPLTPSASIPTTTGASVAVSPAPHTAPAAPSTAPVIPVRRMYATADVRVHDAASTSAAVIGTVHRGEAVAVKLLEGEWLAIDYRGQSAYAASRYFSISQPAAVPQRQRSHADTYGGAGPCPPGELKLRLSSGAFVCARQ